MRDCVRFAPMIGAREGELSPAEATALEAHLARCPTCAAIARSFAATDGLVNEALLARANARDFGPFVDGVMARVAPRGRGEARGPWAWLSRHRRAAVAALAPILAALAVIVYVRLESHGGRHEVALLEISSEGEATTVLRTADGPVVLLTTQGSGS